MEYLRLCSLCKNTSAIFKFGRSNSTKTPFSFYQGSANPCFIQILHDYHGNNAMTTIFLACPSRLPSVRSFLISVHKYS